MELPVDVTLEGGINAAKNGQIVAVDSGHHTASSSSGSSPETMVHPRSDSRGTTIINGGANDEEDDEVAQVMANSNPMEEELPSYSARRESPTQGTTQNVSRGDESAFVCMTDIVSELVDPKPSPPGVERLSLRPIKHKLGVVLLSTTSPTQIMVQLECTDVMLSTHGNVSARLADSMNKLYGNCIDSVAPKVGDFIYENMAVAAYYKDGGGFQAWYRAVITELDLDSNKATIIYVDFGNVATVSTDNMRLLHNSVANIPIIMNSCCLADYHPSDDPKQLERDINQYIANMENFVKSVPEAKFLMEFVSNNCVRKGYYDVYPIRLYTRAGKHLTPQSLISENVDFTSSSPVNLVSPSSAAGDRRRVMSGNSSKPPEKAGPLPGHRAEQPISNFSHSNLAPFECDAIVVEVFELGGRVLANLGGDGRPVVFNAMTCVDPDGFGLQKKSIVEAPAHVGGIYSVVLHDKGHFLYCSSMKFSRNVNCTRKQSVKQASIIALHREYAIACTPASELVILLPEALHYPGTEGLDQAQIQNVEKYSFNQDWLILGGNVQLNTCPCPGFIARMNKHSLAPSLMALSIQEYDTIRGAIAQVESVIVDGYVLKEQLADQDRLMEDKIFLPFSVFKKHSRMKMLEEDTPVRLKICKELNDRRFKYRAVTCQVMGELEIGGNEDSDEAGESTVELIFLGDSATKTQPEKAETVKKVVRLPPPGVNFYPENDIWSELCGRGSPLNNHSQQYAIQYDENEENKPNAVQHIFDRPEQFSCIFCEPPGPVFACKSDLLSHIRGTSHENDLEKDVPMLNQENVESVPKEAEDAFSSLVNQMKMNLPKVNSFKV